MNKSSPYSVQLVLKVSTPCTIVNKRQYFVHFRSRPCFDSSGIVEDKVWVRRVSNLVLDIAKSTLCSHISAGRILNDSVHTPAVGSIIDKSTLTYLRVISIWQMHMVARNPPDCLVGPEQKQYHRCYPSSSLKLSFCLHFFYP